MEDICILSENQVIEDSDEGALEIYAFKDEVECFVTTDTARCIVDLNRARDDFRKDGVIKTHTCFDQQIYKKNPSDKIIKTLLEAYYYPYHKTLEELSTSGVILGIDCHTMSEIAPPISPDSGQERPLVCLSNADGTFPVDWLNIMNNCFQESFQREILLNHPFKGGYIVQAHASEIPWVQVEISRTDIIGKQKKKKKFLDSIKKFFSIIDRKN